LLFFFFNLGENVTMIQSIKYYMGQTFMQDLYDSCKDVFYPVLSVPALAVMCGSWGAEDCTSERWYAFMGDVEGYAPFQIDYVFSDEEDVSGFRPHRAEITPCQNPVPGETSGCSCSDCDDSCVLPVFENEDEKFTIVPGVDGVAFIMVIIFIVGSIIFLAIIVGSNVLQNNALLCKYYIILIFSQWVKN
jgi:Niemann-Pick C1 protein